MKRTLLILSLLTALLVSVAAPSFSPRASAAVTAAPAVTTPRTAPAMFDKTRFLLHAGIAFFAIHHEYKRFQQGYFAVGAPHRVTNVIKAAAVLLIGVHEAKVAYGIAEKSNSTTLHALAAPFHALATKMDAIRAQFAKGQGSAADIQSLNTAASALNRTASTNGTGAIKDVSAPLPSGS